MKKNIFWLIIITVAVSLAFSGCWGCDGIGSIGSGRGANPGDSDNSLIGTWEWDLGPIVSAVLDMRFRLTFTSDSFTYEMMGVRQSISYRLKDNAIIFQEGNTEVEIQYRVNGDTLSIDIGDWMGELSGIGIQTSLDFKRVR